ncbi:hypothetical protein OQJ13_11515 [Legionella sp. PATHC035]|uniref:hypothetical protein n=1 Tax=Legionella sp. PATHC035 TaxID=2992040 RepID=UPI0022434C7D|nr:hypothetical protein [Legionella sp. PATHC035]MCW8409598.1 hypothetical protein [Legionella sp. PATHC035]
MVRPKHPNKDIELAIKYAERKGWRYQSSGNSAHAWGRLLCPLASREGHSMSIWSTPKVPENHAKQIKRNVDACEHQGEENE